MRPGAGGARAPRGGVSLAERARRSRREVQRAQLLPARTTVIIPGTGDRERSGAMRKLILGLAAGVLGLAVTAGVAEAGPRDGPRGRDRGYVQTYRGSKPYYRTHGKAFRGGYYYA